MKAVKATPTAFAENIVANVVVMPFAMEEVGRKNHTSRWGGKVRFGNSG